MEISFPIVTCSIYHRKDTHDHQNTNRKETAFSVTNDAGIVRFYGLQFFKLDLRKSYGFAVYGIFVHKL